MNDVYSVIIVVGIVVVAFGIVRWFFPDLGWELSMKRRLYVEGGTPSDFYYETQQAGGGIAILVGGVMVVGAIFMKFMPNGGYAVYVEEGMIRVPCSYSEVVEMGYRIDASEETRSLKATNSSVKEQRSYIARNAEGKEIEIIIENRADENKLVRDCEVVGISSDIKNGPILQLPNGIQMGMSKEEVLQLHSFSVDSYFRDVISYRESVAFEDYDFTLEFTDDKVSGIEVKHIYH